jgi:ferrochelatase
MTVRTGVLLVNIGTPDSTSVPHVRRYLGEFLMDRYVIDIAGPLRFLLVYGAILPRRPARSAAAYRAIWTERGSPLMAYSYDFARELAARLGPSFAVEVGMRYGRPSLEDALRKLRATGATELVLAPMYPQYSLAATETASVHLRKVLRQLDWAPPLREVPPFYDHPAFVQSFARIGERERAEFHPDHVLFSFHGVPERHVRKTDPTAQHCLATPHCCDRITDANRLCYRAQSFASARAIAATIGLPEAAWSVSFQSRLGRTPWIKPYTDIVYKELAARGVRRLLVFCPSFVADCLETLEEIAIRGREDFRRYGGEDLRLVPSLNGDPGWATGFVDVLNAAPPAARI